MSTTWADVQAEMAADAQWEAVQRELANQELNSVASAIEAGFIESETVISSLISELKVLNPSNNAHSVAVLNCTLIELIDREVIGLPFMIAGLGIHEIDREHSEQIKKMISSGLNSSQFICTYFQRTRRNVEKVKTVFDDLTKSKLPKHELFKVGSNLSHYREKIASFRNYLVHGRAFASKGESAYVESFCKEWRVNIHNPLLQKYSLSLDEDWQLVECEPEAPDKSAVNDETDF